MADFTNPRDLEQLYPLLAELREREPVHFSPPLFGFVVTRYDDVVAGLRDPALSSQRMDLLIRFQLRHSDPAIAKDFERVGLSQMLFRDGAEHHRLRVLGNRGFTPSMLAGARPMIERVVERLIDAVLARGRSGRLDLVADFSQPLPALVIADLFGIPEADRELFQRWSDDVAKFFGATLGDPEKDGRAANEGVVQLERYFLALLEERRRQPGGDLMSLLLAGQAEGKLTAEEVCGQCILILAAGHVTTIDQMANTVNALLENPGEWRRLVANPSLAASAVEEALRYDAAVPFVHRLTRAETTLGGQKIPAGSIVYLGLAAANRDPRAFPDPDRFDIGRTDNRHLSFAVGPHVCLGANLARRELEIGLTALAKRLPELRLAPEPAERRCVSVVFRGFNRLPVEY